MRTEEFREFLRKMPAPLGYKGLNIEKSKLDKIIYCLNIRDHEGYVYFPEVMWAVFYSIVGKNDKGLHDCKPMRNIMRKVKNKYVGLGRNTSLDMLCGNKFYRNEMTVTKYLCGKVILQSILKRRKARLAQDSSKIATMKTSIFVKGEFGKLKSQNYFVRLRGAILKKP